MFWDIEIEKFVVMEKSNVNVNVNVFQLCVKQGQSTLVTPTKETNKGLYFLSNLDQIIIVIVQTIYCFK